MRTKIRQNIPNILSVTRIILAIVVPFFFLNKVACISLYVLVGVSDVLDGFLARRLNATSQLGAKLDTLGDFVFSFSLVISLLLFRGNLIIRFIGWIVLVFGIRVCAFLINGLKNKNFASLHTVANKIAGLTIYVLLIPVIADFAVNISGFFMILIALLSAVEELLLVSIFRDVDSNCKGFCQIIHDKNHKVHDN